MNMVQMIEQDFQQEEAQELGKSLYFRITP